MKIDLCYPLPSHPQQPTVCKPDILINGPFLQNPLQLFLRVDRLQFKQRNQFWFAQQVKQRRNQSAQSKPGQHDSDNDILPMLPQNNWRRRPFLEFRSLVHAGIVHCKKGPAAPGAGLPFLFQIFLALQLQNLLFFFLAAGKDHSLNGSVCQRNLHIERIEQAGGHTQHRNGKIAPVQLLAGQKMDGSGRFP